MSLPATPLAEEMCAIEAAPAPPRHRLSASKLGLARSCLYWARPDVEIPDVDVGSSTAADLGTALHETASGDVEGLDGLVRADDLDTVAERYGLSDSAREQLAALRATWAAWWAEFGAARPWRSEVPVAYDVARDTGRELERGEHRDYHTAATEIPGTVDLHIFEPGDGQSGGTLEILDIKTGRPPKRAADHLDQLAHNALALARIHRPERVRVGIVHVMTDRVLVDWLPPLDAFDLEVTAAELRAAHARIASAEPSAGLHCNEGFCPARAVCPVVLRAVEAAVRTIVPAGEAPDVDGPRRLPLVGDVDDDGARWLVEMLPAIEQWADGRKAAVRARVDHVIEQGATGIAWPDGRVYTRSEGERESPRLEVKGAVDALRTVLGEATEDAIEMRTSKSAIEKVARKVAPKGRVGALRDEAIDALRAIGAVKRSKFTTYSLKGKP